VLVAPSLAAAVQLLSSPPHDASSIETIFVIGGAAAFAEVLKPGSPVQCDKLYLTRVYKELACDVFIPPVDHGMFAITAVQVRGPRQFDTGRGEGWGLGAVKCAAFFFFLHHECHASPFLRSLAPLRTKPSTRSARTRTGP
jgi:hypothetical protein